MFGYKEPSLQDRQAVARAAKEKALAKLRARPAVDPAEMAQRLERQAQKDQALAANRAEAQAAKAAAIAAKKQAAAEKAAQDLVEARPLTAEEQKAARDKRYADRKARKGR